MRQSSKKKNQIEIYFKIVQNVFIVKVVNFLGMSSHTVSDLVNVVIYLFKEKIKST